MQFNSDCAAILSGGLDSTVLTYELVNLGHEPHLLSFNYGQRHKKELDFAKETAFKLGLRHDIVDLSGLTHLISNSALTATKVNSNGDDDRNGEYRAIEVPEGHYAEDTMKQTVVPNRNMIMLSIAAGVAVNNNYKFLATGVHAGDHFVYPDCRPEFIQSINGTILAGNEGFGPFEGNRLEYTQLRAFVQAPFMHKTKTDIAVRAFELDVPLSDTWSCYKGGEAHCGKCGTCVERLEAIHDAALRLFGEKAADNGIFDSTQYEDTQYWRHAIASR
jgi:7-cyano-7-deazaguanine synthase